MKILLHHISKIQKLVNMNAYFKVYNGVDINYHTEIVLHIA